MRTTHDTANGTRCRLVDAMPGATDDARGVHRLHAHRPRRTLSRGRGQDTKQYERVCST